MWALYFELNEGSMNTHFEVQLNKFAQCDLNVTLDTHISLKEHCPWPHRALIQWFLTSYKALTTNPPSWDKG